MRADGSPFRTSNANLVITRRSDRPDAASRFLYCRNGDNPVGGSRSRRGNPPADGAMSTFRYVLQAGGERRSPSCHWLYEQKAHCPPGSPVPIMPSSEMQSG